MSGLMNSLYLGTSGLKTSQNALNTTAHNLANVDTKGYTRQQVILQDKQYKTVSTNHVSVNQLGAGVEVQLVRTVRDQFYDKQYRVETGRKGFYDVQYAAIDEIETVLGETEGEAFQDTMEDLWSAFSELVNDPSNITNRTTAVNTCKVFLERAQQIESQIKDYQQVLNADIKQKVNRINFLGSQIVELNKAIRSVEAGGVQNANDYRDARNLLLDELSGLINISYRELPDGTVTVNAEGVNFVTRDDYVRMEVEPLNKDSVLLKPVWPSIDQDVFTDLSDCNTIHNTDIGSLKGILVGRGEYVANYTDIPIAPEKKNFETEKEYQAALKSYEAAVEKYNKNVEKSSIMSFQAKFDQLVHGVVTAINDILCPNTTIEVEIDGKKQTITVLDTENAPIGMGEGNQIQGTELFTRSGMSRYEEIEVTKLDKDGNPVLDANGDVVKMTVYKYNEENVNDKASLYTLSQIEINEEVLANVNLLPLSSNKVTGEYDTSVVEKINNIWNSEFATLDPNSLTKHTFKDFYTALVGDIATRGNTYKVIAENQETMVNTIENSRVAITGVASEEELTNMIKFQHAYNASSKYINTVSQMLDTIINTFLS